MPDEIARNVNVNRAARDVSDVARGRHGSRSRNSRNYYNAAISTSIYLYTDEIFHKSAEGEESAAPLCALVLCATTRYLYSRKFQPCRG